MIIFKANIFMRTPMHQPFLGVKVQLHNKSDRGAHRFLVSHPDVLRGSSHVPAPRSSGRIILHGEPKEHLRTRIIDF